MRAKVCTGRAAVGAPRVLLEPRQTVFALAVNDMPDSNPALSSVQITGPLRVDGPGDTPSRRRIFSCTPATAAEEVPCP